ncbi:MAG: adenylate kinase [Anaerolineae bacterium]|nr:adenylate kinase [Anaerolineae bacterium]
MTAQPKYIILLGPPGSGKGTQASVLCNALSLPHVASGDLFRYNLKNETELGLKAKAYMDKGELVPDDITIAMVLDRLARPDCQNGVLLDGFPRTLAQAEALDKALAEQGVAINLVLNVQVPDEEIVNRLSGRLICRECQEPFHTMFKPFATCPHGKCKGEHLYQRDDDKPETVRNRLEVYWNQTSPLIQYYQGKGVLTDINGYQDIEAVTADLKAAIANL